MLPARLGELGTLGGPAVRWMSLTMAVAALAGSVGGAAAQYYPPADYPPPPPPGYVGGPVYRDARGDSYGDLRIAERGESLSCLAFPDVALAVDDILG